MGDAKTDAPDAGTPSDVVDEPLTDTGNTGTDNTGKADTGLDKGSAGTDTRTTPPAQNGKKPTSAPTKPAQESAGESPADGPAGQVLGQCSKSGCSDRPGGFGGPRAKWLGGSPRHWPFGGSHFLPRLPA